MPAFSYVAVDGRGKTRRGIKEADAPRQVRAQLRGEGLVPVEVSAVDAERSPRRTGMRHGRRRRIGSAHLVTLTRRLALLLEAGVTVEEALNALIEQGERDATGAVLASVRAEVMSGHSLAVALEGHPSTFPDLYRAVVATGEQSGDLPAVLARLADYLERREAVRQRAGLALVYPAIVAGIALLIVVGLLVYVVPQVVEVFERSRQSLPLLTRVMMGLSGALYAHAAWLVVVAVVLAMGVRALYGRRAFRYKCHAMILKAPVIGSLVRGAESARFASSLAILIGSGVPLLHALATGGKVVSNLVLRHATDQAIRQVREGASLHGALRGTGQFPAIFVHMVASGEASGRLGHMLSQAARQQEAENDARMRLLTSLLEPAIIVVMGVFVLLVVLAVLLPIIEMNQLIRA